MGAIIMSVLVSVIAIVGGLYFYIQDKKDAKMQWVLYIKQYLSLIG